MKQKHTLQWLSAVTGRAKGLVGLLVVVQTVLSVSSIAFAFVLRRIINMAVDGARGGFWASLALLVGILLGQIMLSAAGRFLSEYTSAAVEPMAIRLSILGLPRNSVLKPTSKYFRFT